MRKAFSHCYNNNNKSQIIFKFTNFKPIRELMSQRNKLTWNLRKNKCLQGKETMNTCLSGADASGDKKNWTEIVKEQIKDKYGLTRKCRSCGGCRYKGIFHIVCRPLSTNQTKPLLKQHCETWERFPCCEGLGWE